MGRPRKTSDNVSSPQPAATVPKAAPATPRSSASSRTTPTSSRASGAPAAKSESGRRGQVEKPACATSSRGTGQRCQTRSTAALSSEQGDAKNSRGARAKASSAAGREKSDAAAATQTSSSVSAKPLQAAGKASGLHSPPLPGKVAEIERVTRGQRTNPEWHKWRENRITASVAPRIASSKFANGRSSEVPQSYLKAVVESGSTVQTPAMSWGIRNEKKAVEAYEALKSSKANKPVKVDDCGLFIDKSKAWLAASPDGIVREADTGKELGVLEVKCPYKHRDKTMTEACKDKAFCLEKEGDSFSLKKTHPYYTQVQCQMGVTGLGKADLVVHTNKETVITPVDFDPAFWETTVSKLEKFYTDAVVPHLEQKQSAAVWAKEE
ncbi:uncharacterized protein LOC128352187 [Hemicordylus capensis]|uniref:uncharacterized protein LOC128352187 n=1 Tax=Hemicordylus capensis TaxID=884348 RepID=UPI002302F088|nr:uncharacterized protein LOC128352187 [Hemicordylus capensis]XP_053168490.1 uncharacterized protein LOC128352187 [Hemicordylus capensis]XP_053168491.1 uncharacterized protein LOC128352187 [Hemicordylus capensis]XP_053168492.1 uncharacterized protein LOC128352187 [Hemicordylus capensis]